MRLRCRIGRHEWQLWRRATHETPLYFVIDDQKRKLGYEYVSCSPPSLRTCVHCPATEQHVEEGRGRDLVEEGLQRLAELMADPEEHAVLIDRVIQAQPLCTAEREVAGVTLLCLGHASHKHSHFARSPGGMLVMWP